MQHSKIISGIDIGTSKITTIIGQYFDNEERLNVVAVSSIPAAGFRKGQIINLDLASKTIIQSIESAERMAGFQINDAMVSLAAVHIESLNSHGVVAVSNSNGEISSTDIDRVIEAAKAVALPTGKEIIHVIPRKYTVDGQEGVVDPIGMNGVRLELECHLILSSSSSDKNLHKCLDEVGIKFANPTYSGLTTAIASLTETEKDLGVVLIDIGGTITTLTIFTEGYPCYSAVIPIGGNNITNDIAIGLRLSIEDADKVKLRLNKISENKKFEDEIELSQFGIVSDDKKFLSFQTTVNGIINPRLEEIFTIILQHLELSSYYHQIPAGLVITGGGSQTINLKETCSRTIPLPVRIANPPKVGGIVDEILNPAYTSSIGLLLYSLEEKKKTGFVSDKKNKISLNGVFGKIKNLLQPLLP